MLHVVLVEPEIPPNTGNIARLCLAAGAALHLVHPLGFEINDKTLRRAGMDYWEQLDVRMHANLGAFLEALPRDARLHYLTTKGQRAYWDAEFRDEDYIVFGRETRGLPETLLEANKERLLTIPMTNGARSLNLSTAAGIVLYEAVRQNRSLLHT
jgi:tRNA (cytidine/uridine-2'-O-)-methyltransferase